MFFEILVIVPLPLSAAEKALCYSRGRVGHGPFVTWFYKAQRPCWFLTGFSAFFKTYSALNTRQFHEIFSAKSLLINNFLVSGCVLTEKTKLIFSSFFFCGKECLYSKIVRKWVPIMCAGSLQNVWCTLYVKELLWS